MNICDLICIQKNPLLRRGGKNKEKQMKNEAETIERLKPKGTIIEIKSYIEDELQLYAQDQNEKQEDFQRYVDKKEFFLTKVQ